MKRLLLGMMMMAALLAACSDTDDKDEPAELVDIKPTLTVDRVWSYSFAGDADRLRLALRPAVVDGVAYGAGHKGEVAALDAKSGKKLWSVKIKLPLSAGPAVGADLVVVGATDGMVVALSASDGTERWRQRMSSEVLAAPVIANDRVVVRTVDGRLSGLATADGARRWEVEQTVPRLSLRGTAPAVVAGDSVIAGFDNGRVLAVDLANGDTQWDATLSTPKGKNELERLIDIDAPVRVSGDDVFVVGYQGRIAMLARTSGQIWWARDFSSYRGFALADDQIYASSADGNVVSMRRADGSVSWEQSGLHQRALTAPAVDGPALVVGDYEGYLHWLDAATGDLIARKSTDGERITNAPLSLDGRIYVQTDGGKLIAFASHPKG